MQIRLSPTEEEFCQRYVEFWDSDHSCGVWPMKNITILYKQISFKGFFQQFNSSTAVRWNCVPRFEWSIRSLEPHLIMAPPLLSNPLFYMTVLRLVSFVAMLFSPRSLHERSLFSFSWLRQYWKWIIWVRTLPRGFQGDGKSCIDINEVRLKFACFIFLNERPLMHRKII